MEDFDPKVEEAPYKSWSQKISIRKLNKRKKPYKIIFWLSNLPCNSFGRIQFWKSINQSLSESGLRLDSDFDGFERTKSHIGEGLSRGAAEDEYETPILIS